MLTLKRLFKAILVSSMALSISNLHAAGLLTPVNSKMTPLSIQTHDVTVTIHDSLAVTKVEQVFHNSNSQSLEAIYSFPIPTDAALGGFTYWINGVAVEGEVVKKEKAREIYHEQKSQGKQTALAEQDGHKTFDIKVYPVNANDDVKIELVYFQQQKVDTGIGRYVYPLEDGGVDEHKNSFWTRNETVKQRFSFTLDLRSSYPIDSLRVPKQPSAIVSNNGDKQWRVVINNNVKLDESSMQDLAAAEQERQLPVANKQALNKDVVVYWRQAPNLPGSVDLISYKAANAKQGTFMLTLTPGDDLAPLVGQRDWVFVVDKSGSMAGKFETLIEGMKQGLEKLPQGDRFKVISFNDTASDISGGYQPVSQEFINRVLNQLLENGVDGGTNLYAGVKKGISNLDNDRASAIMLVTDGVANVGIKEKKQFLALLDKRDVRLFSFVMGNSANRPLLEGMSKVSNGFYTDVSNSDDILGQIQLAASKLTHQSMRDITIDIDGVRVSDMTTLDMPTVYRGQQITVLGRYYGDGEAKVTLSGIVDGDKVNYNTVFSLPKQSNDSPEIERLWAYSKIKTLEELVNYLGEDSDSEQPITDLSLAYSIVTQNTSLLVVEEDVFKQHGIKQINDKRRELERNAQSARHQQPINNRVDTKKPMFKKSRPSSGGGGSVSLIGLLVMILLLIARQKISSTATKKRML